MPWTYPAIMATAVAIAAFLFYRTSEPLGLRPLEKLGLGLGAFCGGMIGAKIPFLLGDWQGLVSGTAWLDDGKTIVAGLVGGYFGVQLAEWALAIRVDLGDSLAMPLAVGVAVGRLACFSAGCCAGTVTSLPWGVDFGDGLLRHPAQLYESLFHAAAAVALFQFRRRGILRGRLIRAYFVAYFTFRFATEFIRPEPALWLGLTGYQWASLVLGPFFAVWSCPSCRQPRTATRRPGERAGLAAPACASNSAALPDEGIGKVLKETRTVCPECLRPVRGEVIQRGARVYLHRVCPEHGEATSLVSADRQFYYLRDEVPHPPPACACGEPSHRTCVALLEVTDACNLSCPVCFAGSPSGGHRPFDALAADLESFLAARGPLDVLQLSGGEPLLHPDLLRLIDRAKQLPIEHVMINTNGLELVRRDGLAAELAKRKPHLELNLQMDGLDAASHVALRGDDLLAQKKAAIDRIVEHGLPTTLVCTVVKGINEGQLGGLLRLGLETPLIRGITFQPATWCGRFDAETDPGDRLTLADVIQLVAGQSGGLFTGDDFKPLPCSHPNCCSITFAARPKRGPVTPLARVFDYEDHLDVLSDRVNFNLLDARRCCRGEPRPDEFFRVAVKPFMDAHTFDQERIDECCIHVIRPGGKAVSFCRYNILERNRTTRPLDCLAE